MTTPRRIADGRGKFCSKPCGIRFNQRTHGHAAGGKLSRTYTSWAMMRSRCTNPKAPNFDRYGGRGITVCAEWGSFSAFLTDMGERPEGMTLDRKDNDGPYCKENCQWQTVPSQQRNRRNNVMIEHDGKTLCASDWAKLTGIDKNTLLYRLKHWPIERALTP
jgi:hypothetical protein